MGHFEPAATAGEWLALCACDACALLFGEDTTGRYRAVPRDVEVLPEVRLSDAGWRALGVPIRLAFFVRDDDRATGGRAVYPSAAGPVSASVDASAFALLEVKSASVARLLPRVEALLVHAGAAGERAYRAPTDVCYRLVGLLRSEPRASRAIERFFDELEARYRSARGA